MLMSVIFTDQLIGGDPLLGYKHQLILHSPHTFNRSNYKTWYHSILFWTKLAIGKKKNPLSHDVPNTVKTKIYT